MNEVTYGCIHDGYAHYFKTQKERREFMELNHGAYIDWRALAHMHAINHEIRHF